MKQKLGNILWAFRPRFGLRALLLAVTLICLWLGREAERWHREQTAWQALMHRTRTLAADYSLAGVYAGRLDDRRDLPVLGKVCRIHFERPPSHVSELLTEFSSLDLVSFGVYFANGVDYRFVTNLQRDHEDIDVVLVDYGGELFDADTRRAKAEWDALQAERQFNSDR